MKIQLTVLMVGFGLVNLIAAQEPTGQRNNEFFVGYSSQHADADTAEWLNGFAVSYVRNVHRFVGLKADLSAAFGTERTSITPEIRFERARVGYLGGIQVKDNRSKRRISPFAHFLAGAAYTRSKRFCEPCLAPLLEISDVGFSMAAGGGIDIRVNDRLSIRAIQADLNPTRSGGAWEHNARFAFGFVIR